MALGVNAGVARTVRSKRAALRRVLDVAHRWAGFGVGLFLATAGLTGALLAFYLDLESAFDPSLKTARPHALPASYEAVWDRLEHIPTPEAGYWSIEVPPHGGPITSRFYRTSFRSMEGGASRIRMVTLDPTDLHVMRDVRWGDTFFTWIYDLHWKLLMGPVGKLAMGVAALGGVTVLLSGLAIWLLPGGPLAAKLRFKRPAGAQRRIYDLHKLGGVYGFVLLTLCIGTGALLNLSDQVQPILDSVSPLRETPAPKSRPSPGAQRIDVDTALKAGARRTPGSRTIWIRMPTRPEDPYTLEILQKGEPATRFPKSRVWIDQYTGEVLAVQDARRSGAGDTILAWLSPLHTGQAFGLAGRMWVMALGLFPAFLLATGFIRWQHKRSSKRRLRRRRQAGRTPT